MHMCGGRGVGKERNRGGGRLAGWQEGVSARGGGSEWEGEMGEGREGGREKQR